MHQGLRDKGPVKVPREFVFMDRAAIGLGGVFLHLNAELNFYRLFNDTSSMPISARWRGGRSEAFTAAGVPLLPQTRLLKACQSSRNPGLPAMPALCYFGPRRIGASEAQ